MVIQDVWEEGKVPLFDGILFSDGKAILFERGGRNPESLRPEDWARKSTDLETLRESGVAWATLQESARLEMEDENLRLTSGKAGGETGGYVAVEEMHPRRLLWIARFGFSHPFFTVKHGDHALIADSQDFWEWKFPLGKPDGLTIGPSEERPAPDLSLLERKLKEGYPVLHDFLESTLWPDVDGYNPIELLHQIAYHGAPDRTQKLIRELRTLYADDGMSGEAISSLFNKADIDHPYRVVNGENAKDFCYSMHESLRFIASLRK